MAVEGDRSGMTGRGPVLAAPWYQYDCCVQLCPVRPLPAVSRGVNNS